MSASTAPRVAEVEQEKRGRPSPASSHTSPEIKRAAGAGGSAVFALPPGVYEGPALSDDDDAVDAVPGKGRGGESANPVVTGVTTE